MGNEAGKGKYAKMDKVEAPETKGDQGFSSDGSSSYAAQNTESKRSPTRKFASLRQGINSGYHSIVLSPKADEKDDPGGIVQK